MPFEDITKPPRPLPKADRKPISQGITLLPPLSRKGTGPGLVVLVSKTSDVLIHPGGVPSPLNKWAEEGFTVVEIESSAWQAGKTPIADAIAALKSCDKYEDTGKVGLVAYDAQSWNSAASSLTGEIPAVVIYANEAEKASIAKSPVPALQHLAGSQPEDQPPSSRSKELTTYNYPQAKSHSFATPASPEWVYSLESVSHTRSLQFLKPILGGPYFDLEYIWDEHTYYEFADRSVEHTMATMVQEPYVNHVPTMTGGIGRERLSAFYRGHFIFNNSADTELELLSRTVGIDRIIDEFIFKFTHDQEIDWILPGVPPTNLKVEIPFTAIVNIRGDRLYHEHIGWDQGSVLRQLGLMPEFLPFPYALPDGKKPAEGKQFEYRVPVAGLEVASKMRLKESVESNEMFEYKIREVAKKS